MKGMTQREQLRSRGWDNQRGRDKFNSTQWLKKRRGWDRRVIGKF